MFRCDPAAWFQARLTKRDVGQRHAGSARRVEWRAEDAAEESSLKILTSDVVQLSNRVIGQLQSGAGYIFSQVFNGRCPGYKQNVR